MGWLHCEPDNLFKPRIFGLQGTGEAAPSHLAWLFGPLARLLNNLALDYGLSGLLEFTFVARPIQVLSCCGERRVTCHQATEAELFQHGFCLSERQTSSSAR